MKRLALTLVAFGFLAVPTLAQKMGATNRNAPAVKQTITLDTLGTLSLDYTAITFGSGRWAASLENEETRDRMRERINQQANDTPLAAFTTEKDVEFGGKNVPAGKYQMSFTISDDYKWQVTLTGEETISIPLTLEQTEMASKRLVVSLHAGDEDGTAGIYIAFGQQWGLVAIKPAAAA